MSVSLAYPIINGYEPSYSSIEIVLGGTSLPTPLPGIKAISYKEPLKNSKLFANSVYAQGRTRGQVEPAGSIEFYKRMWDAAIEILSGGGLWGYAEKSWSINICYAETGFGVVTDVLEGVRFHSPDQSNTEGTDALTVKCELDILKPIKWHQRITALSQGLPITIG
jgi:hypothetical protein